MEIELSLYFEKLISVNTEYFKYHYVSYLQLAYWTALFSLLYIHVLREPDIYSGTTKQELRIMKVILFSVDNIIIQFTFAVLNL